MKHTRWLLLALVVAVTPACKKKKDGEPGAGTGSDTGSQAMTPPDAAAMAGTGSGSGSETGSGSAPAAGPEITFADVPEGWEIGDGKGELAVGVNDSKFPVDNAVFVIEYGFETTPTDPKQYPTTKKLANGQYFENKESYRYVLDAGDKKIVCGGSLYKDKDYNKIPKERDAAVAAAKKLCESAKVK